MPACCKSDNAHAVAMEFALTLSDKDIHSVASGLLLDSIDQNHNNTC
jgi:hypothetical protein